MKKIVVLKTFQPAEIKMFAEAAGDDYELIFAPRRSKEEQLELLKDAEICVGEPALDIINQCPDLKLVQMTWAGTDLYTRSGKPFPENIRLCNASGAFGQTMAQHALGAVLSLYRHFPGYQRQQEAHLWKYQGVEKSIIGTTVLIYGAGDIGSCCANLFRALGSVQIIGVRRKPEVPDFFDAVCTLAEAEKYLPEADIVIGCMPNTDDNQGYLNADRLALMKADAVLVNMGRGPFIDNIALAEVLKERKIYGAALDVTQPEPLPTDHPLWDCDNLILTPHIAGPSFGNPLTEHIMAEICCHNILAIKNGTSLRNLVL